MKDERDIGKLDNTIHEGFCFNEALELPTLIREYKNVERTLERARHLACITVQIGQLREIEYSYGSMLYNEMLLQVTDILKELKKRTFRDNDIIVIDLYHVDTFIIFLSEPRKKETQLLDHLDEIAERIRVHAEQRIFQLFYPYQKKFDRMAIGHSLVIKNPMINPMRQIMQLISDSLKMGEIISVKKQHSCKFDLQKILIEEKISTLYQPIVDMESFDIIGYEALSRGPADTEFANPLLLFIIAAECGLSFELDRLCRQKAFSSIRNLHTDKKIFVNTLTMTIHDPEFRGQYLEQLLSDLKLKPENVVFEISETLAIDNYEIFRRAMQEYSDIGIVHAGDDIGKGYSDLERVMELKPGYLKIDMSFVRNIHQNYIKQEIVKAVIHLAEGINSIIVAEGIETKEEYLQLRKLGVRLGQGYLFAKPTAELVSSLQFSG